MKISTKCAVSVFAAIGIIGTGSTCSAQIFQELFTSSHLTSSGDEALSQIGWAADGYQTPGGWAGYYDARSSGSLINTGTGLPVSAPGTAYGAGAAYIGWTSGTYNGALYTDDTMGSGTYGYVSFADISLSVDPTLQFSVLLQQLPGWSNGALTPVLGYILVENGGNWYASAAGLTAPTSTDPGGYPTWNGSTYGNFDPASLTLTAAKANWVTVTGVGTGTITLGSTPANDLSGNITGVGILENVQASGEGGSWNVADYSISAVPEPSLLALLGLGGFGLIAAYRRRMA